MNKEPTSTGITTSRRLWVRHRRTTVGVAAAVAMAVSLAACSAAADEGSSDDEPIVIGTAQSLTGEYQALGVSYRAGIEYAVELANEAGGIDGREIVLELRDDQSKPDQAVVAFNAMIDEVDAFVGPGGANTAQAVVDLVQRAQVPDVSPSGFSVVGDDLSYVFEASPSSTATGEAMAQYVSESGATTVFAVVNTDDGGMVDGWEATLGRLESLGVEVVGVSEVGFATTDYAATLAQVRATSVDTVVAWLGGPPAVAFAQQYEQAGLAPELLQSNAVAAEYYYASGAGVEGTLVATPLPVVRESLPESEYALGVAEIADGYAERNDALPDMFAYAGYAAVQVLVEAMRQAEDLSSEGIQESLDSLSLTTLMGPVDYASGDRSGPGNDYVAIGRVESGILVANEWSVERLSGILD